MQKYMKDIYRKKNLRCETINLNTNTTVRLPVCAFVNVLNAFLPDCNTSGGNQQKYLNETFFFPLGYNDCFCSQQV